MNQNSDLNHFVLDANVVRHEGVVWYRDVPARSHACLCGQNHRVVAHRLVPAEPDRHPAPSGVCFKSHTCIKFNGTLEIA